MCRRVTCSNCGKATWSGCGQHIEEALAGVPEAERCDGKCTPAAPAKSGFSLFRRRS